MVSYSVKWGVWGLEAEFRTQREGNNVTSSPFCFGFVRDMGERYRREMLAHGGAKEPMLMVEGNSNTLLTVPPTSSQWFFFEYLKKPLGELKLVWIGFPPVYLRSQSTSWLHSHQTEVDTTLVNSFKIFFPSFNAINNPRNSSICWISVLNGWFLKVTWPYLYNSLAPIVFEQTGWWVMTGRESQHL